MRRTAWPAAGPKAVQVPVRACVERAEGCDPAAPAPLPRRWAIGLYEWVSFPQFWGDTLVSLVVNALAILGIVGIGVGWSVENGGFWWVLWHWESGNGGCNWVIVVQNG